MDLPSLQPAAGGLQQQAVQPPAGPEQQLAALPGKQAEAGFDEGPKAALKKGLEESQEDILFSCNICYDVSGAGEAGDG